MLGIVDFYYKSYFGLGLRRFKKLWSSRRDLGITETILEPLKSILWPHIRSSKFDSKASVTRHWYECLGVDIGMT